MESDLIYINTAPTSVTSSLTSFLELLFFFLPSLFRFQCEKLVLVGDPKQLPPTIQGSESVHGKGLEQTLFDRLCLMVGPTYHIFTKDGNVKL